MTPSSNNFDFLRAQQPLLAQLATLAERYSTDDPVTFLIKLRQFGEALARQVAASASSYASYEELQADLLHWPYSSSASQPLNGPFSRAASVVNS